MEIKELEKSVITFKNLFGVPKIFSLRTPRDFHDSFTETLTSPEQRGRYYFISVNIPEDHIIKVRSDSKLFGSLKQHLQYRHFERLLLTTPIFKEVYEVFTWFEQTKKGNIHFHQLLVLDHDSHKHDYKCYLFDMLKLKGKKALEYAIDITEINDYNGIYEYAFNKTTKSYENIDQNLFKPIIYKT